MVELDRARSAGVTYRAMAGATTGDEPLIIDLVLPPVADAHHIIEELVLVAHLVTQRPDPTDGQVPISGLFLCPEATPTETLAEAVAGWSQVARPFPLSICVDTVPIGTGGFALSYILTSGYKLDIPQRYFLRAIVNCAPGTAAPGPGAGSAGVFRALIRTERDRC